MNEDSFLERKSWPVKKLRYYAPYLTGKLGVRVCVTPRTGSRAYSEKKRGNGFKYLRNTNSVVRDPATILRIKRLAIPPAWTKVWICPDENGHLQATGRDSRGRKQYRYHSDWRSSRDENKFGRILAFARALPRIRRSVRRNLKCTGMPRAKVLATIVRLLEATLIRVGNDEYARANGSYGLTTMRNRHVTIAGNRMTFSFRGKGGKSHEIALTDPKLARIVRRCQELPGQELFVYEDENGATHDISSGDVNGYIREASGNEFTAKDFRTWAGTVLAAAALRDAGAAPSLSRARKNVNMAIETVARTLGNTPAICRKCYVHPAIIEAYLKGHTIPQHRKRAGSDATKFGSNLNADEAAVLAFLKARR